MFLFRALRPIDAAFARHADASSYRALLREMQAADLYAGTPYAVLQKRAGRMWSAIRRYRAEQRAVRTHARGTKRSPPPFLDERRMAPQNDWPAAAGYMSFLHDWPAAHAGCVMQ